MTTGEWLRHIAEALKAKNFEDPQFEARALVQEALDLTSTDLILHVQETPPAEMQKKLQEWLSERGAGVPLAYLAGRKGFYKNIFHVSRGVLIPRPETELVVTTALARAAQPIRVIADLGCGSGCIGLSLLGEWPEAKLYAVDRAPAAIQTTTKNAERLHLLLRTEVLQSDAESWASPEPLDVVVGNPPYIPEGDPRVDTHVHKYEPHEALYALDEGLHALRAWSRAAAQNLKPEGLVVFEFGAGQGERVRKIMQEADFKDIQIVKDLAGLERVVSAKK